MTKRYTDRFAISQTSLKDWGIMSPAKWAATWITKTRKRPKKVATYFGSYLDCLLFTPSLIEKRFIIATVKPPSAKIVAILNSVYEHVEELNNRAIEANKDLEATLKIPMKEHILDDKELVNKYTEEHDHFAGKLDQAYNDVVKKGKLYFDFLISTKGKTVITPEEKADAEKLAKILCEHKVSKGFFVPKDGCEVVFQQYIFTEMEMGLPNVEVIPLKGAIDIIHFNHKLKQVREVDLKCTEDAFAFDSPQGPVRRFDYPSQHSFYDFLLRTWLQTYQGGKYKDYSVMNPLNVVIDRHECLPYIYSYNQNDLHIKRFGIEGTKIKGWQSIIEEIAFHIDKNDWTYPMNHLKNGMLEINVFSKR